MVTGSLLEPKAGDWLEHEALGRNRSRLGKLAEVIDVLGTELNIFIEGEGTRQTITRADLARWWNLFTPAKDPEDILPPKWLREGREFQSTSAHGQCLAVVRIVKGAWLSFEETCTLDENRGALYQNVLRIKSYKEFASHGWIALHRPSVWDWIQHPLV